MKKFCVFVVLLLVSAGDAHSQVRISPDHFKCYHVQEALGITFSIPLTLQDQFDIPNEELVRLIDAVRFCNPVEEAIRGGPVFPILNPDNHLTMYLLNPQPVVARIALVKDQFGLHRLRVWDPQVLAVPSQKLAPFSHEPPSNLDHYKCYRASGEVGNRAVRLRDEFDAFDGQSDVVKVISVIGFCNPVRKTHPDGTALGVSNAQLHMTCYAITRTDNAVPDVAISNQLSNFQTLILGRADILCVPARKLKWEPITFANRGKRSDAEPRD